MRERDEDQAKANSRREGGEANAGGDTQAQRVTRRKALRQRVGGGARKASAGSLDVGQTGAQAVRLGSASVTSLRLSSTGGRARPGANSSLFDQLSAKYSPQDAMSAGTTTMIYRMPERLSARIFLKWFATLKLSVASPGTSERASTSGAFAVTAAAQAAPFNDWRALDDELCARYASSGESATVGRDSMVYRLPAGFLSSVYLKWLTSINLAISLPARVERSFAADASVLTPRPSSGDRRTLVERLRLLYAQQPPQQPSNSPAHSFSPAHSSLTTPSAGRVESRTIRLHARLSPVHARTLTEAELESLVRQSGVGRLRDEKDGARRTDARLLERLLACEVEMASFGHDGQKLLSSIPRAERRVLVARDTAAARSLRRAARSSRAARAEASVGGRPRDAGSLADRIAHRDAETVAAILPERAGLSGGQSADALRRVLRGDAERFLLSLGSFGRVTLGLDGDARGRAAGELAWALKAGELAWALNAGELRRLQQQASRGVAATQAVSLERLEGRFGGRRAEASEQEEWPAWPAQYALGRAPHSLTLGRGKLALGRGNHAAEGAPVEGDGGRIFPPGLFAARMTESFLRTLVSRARRGGGSRQTSSMHPLRASGALDFALLSSLKESAPEVSINRFARFAGRLELFGSEVAEVAAEAGGDLLRGRVWAANAGARVLHAASDSRMAREQRRTLLVRRAPGAVLVSRAWGGRSFASDERLTIVPANLSPAQAHTPLQTNISRVLVRRAAGSRMRLVDAGRAGSLAVEMAERFVSLAWRGMSPHGRAGERQTARTETPPAWAKMGETWMNKGETWAQTGVGFPLVRAARAFSAATAGRVRAALSGRLREEAARQVEEEALTQVEAAAERLVLRREEVVLRLPRLSYVFARAAQPNAGERRVAVRMEQQEMAELVRSEVQTLMKGNAFPAPALKLSRADYAMITDRVYGALTRRLLTERERLGLHAR